MGNCSWAESRCVLYFDPEKLPYPLSNPSTSELIAFWICMSRYGTIFTTSPTASNSLATAIFYCNIYNYQYCHHIIIIIIIILSHETLTAEPSLKKSAASPSNIHLCLFKAKLIQLTAFGSTISYLHLYLGLFAVSEYLLFSISSILFVSLLS